MLPAIGIMIGFYIFTRCLSFCDRKGDRAESGVVKVFSSITLLVTVVVIIYLLVAGVLH